MSPEEIIEDEIDKWAEYLDMTSQNQTAAFLVGILAHRCERAEVMVEFLKEQIERNLKNGT